jgi:ABC-type phosphate transport system substrate-binding protein
MRKILFALALAAVPALAFTACNGSGGGAPGTSALPAAAQHGGSVHHLDAGVHDMHGGGATFPAYGYNLGNQPVGLYTGSQPTPGPGSILGNATTANGDSNQFLYCLTGSGYGRKEFEGVQMVGASACAALGASATGFGGRGDPIDWAGSDVALPSTECCSSGSTYETTYGATYGEPFEIPTFGGPIVIPYINSGGNGLTGLGKNQLTLSTWTYCAIAEGTVGNWDDPAITEDNGGVPVVGGSQPITFYYRSDGSGTTYLFENKLNTTCVSSSWKGKFAKKPYEFSGHSADWTFGLPGISSLNWTGPTGAQASGSTFLGASGNPGILECIQGLTCTPGSAFPYGTGYAEGAWAAAASSPSVQQAALQSGTASVSPTNQAAVAAALAGATASKIQYGMGSDGISLGSSTPYCQVFMPPTAFVNPPAGAYPIVGLSYWLFYGKHQVRSGVHHYNDLKGLIKYLESNAGVALLAPIEYSPLPASTRKAVGAAFKGNTSQKPCFNP